jgi:hypothetical protein
MISSIMPLEFHAPLDQSLRVRKLLIIVPNTVQRNIVENRLPAEITRDPLLHSTQKLVGKPLLQIP